MQKQNTKRIQIEHILHDKLKFKEYVLQIIYLTINGQKTNNIILQKAKCYCYQNRLFRSSKSVSGYKN